MVETVGAEIIDAEIATDQTLLGGLKRRYVLLMLLGAYTLSFLDRQVVNILAESIKRDLHISNLQLGMLTGLAFAAFYTFLGIPIARLAERRSRPLIIAGSMALWSGFTVLSGQATNFATMGIARLGVGFGEAGCNPCAHSLIADITPPGRRGSALAFYALGAPIGTILGLIIGGVVADAYGWRMAFMVAGAPGLILALIIALTIKEPRLQIAAHIAARALAPRSFSQTLNELLPKRTFWLMAAAAGLATFVGYGHASFSTSFFLRLHGAQIAFMARRFGLGPLAFLGIARALTAGVGGLIGTWLGGWLADKAGAHDKRAYMSLPAIASLAALPFIYLVYSVKSPLLALGLGLFQVLLTSLGTGGVYATAQSVVKPLSRATSAAVLLFIINMIGLGLGPMCVGALNDLLAGPVFGLGQGEGVRWALILSASVLLVAAGLFWWARDTVREDIIS